MKWEVETRVKDFGEKDGYDYIEVEDGGSALIYNIEADANNDTGFFVQLRSWNDNIEGRLRDYDIPELREAHPDFAALAGKRVRVTVETLED